MLFLLVASPPGALAQEIRLYAPPVENDSQKRYIDPFRTPRSYRGPEEEQWPEYYIDPVADHLLDLILPKRFRKYLSVDSGYDRYEGLPTLTADGFLPVKAWNDKSFFFTQRLSLESERESFSLGIGLRKLINTETMIGFSAFHDWVRPRGSTTSFLREAGLGVELSLLPGRHADLDIRANAYLPVNERRIVDRPGETLAVERLSTGWDADVRFLLPAVTNRLDAELTARFHSFRGELTDGKGYKGGIALNSRDGMLSASFEAGRNTDVGNHYKLEGNLTLAFDWSALLKGGMPFSAPYAAPDQRYDRWVPDGLYERPKRARDIPVDRSERRTSFLANVVDGTVSLHGGFPELPNRTVTVQTATSPWRDRAELVTDSEGFYSARVKLPPGKYKVRVIHKPTGRVSSTRLVTVRGTPG
jgi:hypothetical protein